MPKTMTKYQNDQPSPTCAKVQRNFNPLIEQFKSKTKKT